MPERGVCLAARAAELLPPGACTASALPWQHYPLWPGEDAANMVPKRAAEFSAGREAARLAMVKAGLAPRAIPKGADRAPVWPEGVAASISHSASACIAAVSRSARAIGVDIEPLRVLEPPLAALIRTGGDLVGTDMADPGLLLFCAKEAVYKAQYPLSCQLFGPEALSVEIRDGTIRARFRIAAAPFAAGDEMAGRIAVCAGHVLALAWL